MQQVRHASRNAESACPFLYWRDGKKGHAESAFRDACRTCSMQYRRGVVSIWSMFVFLTMLTLYPDGRLTGFALATKTSGAAKVYWKRLNSKKKVSVLKWASESEYFQR